MKEETGSITRILYQKDDFLIAVLRTESEEIKIKGNIYGVEKGETVTVRGIWENHPKYGEQLAVESWERPIPQTEEQILALLTSSLVKGCGKKQAEEIVQKFGGKALEVISDERESCLLGIRGIGKKRAKKIVDSVISTYEVQRIVSELLVYGITANMALRAYREYGANTVATLKRNPYKLTELDLVGFQKADEIARRIGIMPTSGYRIEACLQYVLQRRCMDSGHTYIPKEELLEETEKALNHQSEPSQMVSMDELEDSLMCLEEKLIVNEDECIYPKFLYQQEEKLSRKLSKMRGSRYGRGMPECDRQMEKYQRKNQMILAEKQREAIKQLFREQILILTGGPGTGKTTVVKAMIDIYQKMYPKDSISLAAPTGRASRKLSEITGHEASTIHRLIGYRQGERPEYNKDNKLPCKLLVLDEMSMVDVSLASYLFQALDPDTKVLMVGDIDQLPSVSPGNVLRDMIHAGIPTVRLTEVFRQAQESQIINNAHRINQGKSILFDKEKGDFFFLLQEDPGKIAELMVKSAKRFMEMGYSLSDILLLSPMRKGPAGTIALNEQLREALNPRSPEKLEWKVGKRLFRKGDKVVQIQTNYDKQVFNGDMGIIQSFTFERGDNGDPVELMEVNFDGNVVSYAKNDVKELELGYAITIHKSQGGEAPIVIMPVTASHYVMLARNLIYTGMTRAREKVVFIGTDKAMNIAIQNNQIAKRNSSLAERLVRLKAKRKDRKGGVALSQ
ncbi:ATP-dependent RecD-like DNA helicase [Virgibacillus xinjiangensis]|uniref:ATP-dependent RecD2 DNA helicase n=1 Tax=Virgibacillus xinjiangensis TaxID=393090 RepID=A0ABV7D086_9BACI